MELTVYFINAFTEQVFKGNSAAVIITDTWLDENLMQSIASENNLSETAFVVKDDAGIYHIRWFSPLTEIDFCGHATLASAYVLFQQNPGCEQLFFSAKAVGTVTVKQAADGYIEMNFPSRKPEPVSTIPAALLDGLSIKPEHVLKNQQAYLVVLKDETSVRAVKSDSELLKTLAPFDVMVTAPADSHDYDFVSRYFWPANGGDEDPVTGSAHAGLTPYWAEQLNKQQLTAYQASKRGGHLLCQMCGDRVLVSGKAVQYLVGTIAVG